MKALLVSDLHYELRQFDWLNAVAPEFDTVVSAGDHFDIVSTVPVQAQLVVVLNHLKRLNQQTRLLTASGNHDLDGLNAAGEKTASWMVAMRKAGILGDGDRFESDGTLVSICPWWDGPAARDEVAAQLSADAERRTGRPRALRMLARRTKFRFGADVHQRLCQEGNPGAIVFGTDLPSTRAERPFELADVQLVRRALANDTAELALGRNPERIYGRA